jgi:hypothetical protein
VVGLPGLEPGTSSLSANAGNRCDKRRSCRSCPTVDPEVMCSHRVQLCALILHLVPPLLNKAIQHSAHEHHVAHHCLPVSMQQTTSQTISINTPPPCRSNTTYPPLSHCLAQLPSAAAAAFGPAMLPLGRNTSPATSTVMVTAMAIPTTSSRGLARWRLCMPTTLPFWIGPNLVNGLPSHPSPTPASASYSPVIYSV